MKKLLSLLIVLFSITTTGFGQSESAILKLGTDDLYSYEKVFDVPGKSSNDIYDAIKRWVVSNIKSQANTNFFDDKALSITTAPIFQCSWGTWIDFKMNIDIKDGKYRLKASSFIYHHNNGGITRNLGDFSGMGLVFPNKVRQRIMNDANDWFEKMLASVQGSIEKKSDW